MAQDTKPPLPTTSSPEDLDLPPPSYDSALATSGSTSAHQQQHIAGSSSAQPLSDRTVPEHIAHLFTGAPNAEPLLGRNCVPPEQIKAVQWRQKGKTIETCDAKLSDPAVLYDFIRAQAMTPPNVKVVCRGMHTETVEQSGMVMDNGVNVHKRRGETHTVIDFDFTIDLSDIIDHPSNITHIQLRAVPPDVAAHRGSHLARYGATFAPARTQEHHRHRHAGYQSLVSEYGPTDAGRPATFAERRDRDAWNAFRMKKGIPGWIKMQDNPEFWESRNKGKAALQLGGGTINAIEDAQGSADPERGEHQHQAAKPELRAWCEKFCADRGPLKEFHLLKGIYGWDIQGLTSAISGAILSTGYQSNFVNVSLDVEPTDVIVRPSNIWSRAIGNPFIYFLAWVTLIYPLVWILKHLIPKAGAPYEVALASYGMKCYPPLPSTFPSEDISSAQDRLPGLYKLHPELPENPTLQYGPKGVHYLVGRKEGQWFREWEERIRMGVRTRFKGQLQGGVVSPNEASVGLDGY
ncbi:hypothetical protein I317_01238 [Kwoniella heveanensis CBS 569]|uniref:Uncharacterized protein n=1 Tax=Kwoniella heveanensis BCC8398 TaxID=1296120 RepID=A0A1B9GHV3_9TREE|nr:hypothetical protein I316_07776 [Kwoniella heveanensis BCC8398]OCF44958.1 hypothetical protein I317_01238 [Kwoniella heveanensis CBS 569]